ncbi:hypothetical protein QE390_000138 [Siphonobacter sp. SORGH_AS 1065]|nr:hypothetical protein [Siphonobacter sp. SORGH_AS_1065]
MINMFDKENKRFYCKSISIIIILRTFLIMWLPTNIYNGNNYLKLFASKKLLIHVVLTYIS